MDFRAVALPIGRLLIVVAAFMMIPAGADLVARNPDWVVFATSALVSGCIGALLSAALARRAFPFRPRETFLFVNAAWFTFSFAGAIPLYASGLDISFADAFFEAASGLTTTGSTILTGLDGLPPGILLWRSLLQWIGGIGIVVIGIWLLPGLRVGGSQLFAIESSEKTAKPYGRIEPFLFRLLGLYLVLTLSCGLLYYLAGMTAFQAINHAMTTISTGGFSTSDSSMGQFSSLAILWIAIVYMLASGMPFLFLIKLAERREVPHPEQVRVYLLFVAGASFLAFLSMHATTEDTPFRQFTHSVFNIVSVVTTTGYATTDYLQWGNFAIALFFVLTFFGGCSGSTSGGFKIFRVAILLSSIRAILKRIVHPHRIIEPRFGGAKVTPGVMEGVLIFSVLYAGTFAVFAAVYAALGLDLATALSASATALANVGPGVGPIIGPAGTFQSLSDPVKWLLAVQMILGRLELIGGILVLTPDFWTET
ncbi:TrkH family potassium uptake protein [Polymorphum gilvum]|uniref:Trk system potassium uptake protein n=1 Tax=Polymorphum gilvum (strain LMG 25793 / CGMCC 1.9160 / SL003B-26A1) TaxID=991905 RepID=F2IZB3_POLGS|nr:TrkH family potassium uptake protein [Polymorphum gilvum]ADZ68536.1 Probable trk system potassium uptake transmembrane protein [Polymorphum gilvum SL003B-26A1]